MTDLRQRIYDALGDHIPSNVQYVSGCDCGSKERGVDWRWHVADVLVAVLQPDTDTVAKAICAVETRDPIQWQDLSDYGKDQYRRMTQAAINAWTGTDDGR